jgi:hypothetical protein
MCQITINPTTKQVKFDGSPADNHLTDRQKNALAGCKRLVQVESGAWYVADGCDWRKAQTEAQGKVNS